VVALYLLPDLNMQLRPMLLKDLKREPGSYPMNSTCTIGSRIKWAAWAGQVLLLGGARGGGRKLALESGLRQRRRAISIDPDPEIQEIDGRITTPISTVAPLEAYLIGTQIGFVLRYRPGGKQVEMRSAAGWKATP